MKKLFLILIPIVLLFTGCHDGNYVTIYRGRDQIDEIEPLSLTDENIDFIAKTAVEQNKRMLKYFDRVVVGIDLNGKRYVYTILTIENMRRFSSAYSSYRTNKLWTKEMRLDSPDE